MAQKKTKKSTKKRNTSLFGAAVVVIALIIIVLIFIVKKDQILSNFKDTRFFDRVIGTTPEFIQNHESTPKEEVTEPEVVTLNLLKEDKKSESKKQEVVEAEKPAPVVQEPKAETSKVETPKAEVKPVETPKAEPKKEEPVKKAEPPKPAVTNVEYQVCYVFIDPDGSILRKMVKRSTPKSDSPLTSAIALLLKGPDKGNSAEKNYMTLIPSGTKLLSAKVQDGVAYLNFNSEFEVNEYGIDGFQGQLMQVVYTATAFSTVNSVQFLIEGEKREYLSEGIWIGSPLSRSSF